MSTKKDPYRVPWMTYGNLAKKRRKAVQLQRDYLWKARGGVRTNIVERKIWACAKAAAVKKGLAFDIAPEDIVIPTHCPTWASN